MPIPREILNVPRPKNTVVIAYGPRQKAIRCPAACRLQKRRWPSPSGERSYDRSHR